MSAVGRWTATANAAAWMILVVTGVWLMFGYEPIAPAGATDDLALATGNSLSRFMQDLHLFAGVMAVVLSILVGLLALREQDWSGRIASAIAVAGVAATFAVGRLLPWSALALVAVELDTQVRGYVPLLTDNVRFVLFPSAGESVEISRSTVLLWLALHIVVLPGLVLTSLRSILRNRPERRVTLVAVD